jgi:hypothetical protein
MMIPILILLFSLVPYSASAQSYDKTVYAAAYGMKCDGVTDDTASLQAAINASQGLRLQLPPGTCLISSTVTVGGTTNPSKPYNNFDIEGYGNCYAGTSAPGTCTTLQWNGPATIPAINLQTRDSTYRKFGIIASVGRPLLTGIQSCSTNYTTHIISTGNHYEDITLDGTNGGLGKGFQFVVCSGGSDANNDVNYFDRVKVANFSTAGWSFEHSQSKTHRLHDCTFEGLGAATSLYGVTTSFGGGSFAWWGGSGGAVAIDFYMGNANDAILIDGWNSEGSAQLLKTGVGGTDWPITIQGTRFADNNWSSATPYIVDFEFGGGLNINGSVIADTCSHAAKMRLTATNALGSISNSLFCSNATEATAFSGTGFQVKNVMGAGNNSTSYWTAR